MWVMRYNTHNKCEQEKEKQRKKCKCEKNRERWKYEKNRERWMNIFISKYLFVKHN